MQNGSMFSDIWDGLAPLSATFYQGFTWLFGRSILMLMILGSLLTFFQAVIINVFSIKTKLFENNTYLPALVYILLTSTHPTFFTISPTLMGLTFVLLGLGKLISHVEFRAKADIHIILIGLYFGLSPLFDIAFIVIIPISVLLLILFSNTTLRRYFLLFVTSITPLIITFFYYWIINDHPAYFVYNFILINNYDVYYQNIRWINSVINLGFAFFFFIIGLVTIGKQRRLTNYQYRIAQLYFVLAVLTMSFFLIKKPITPYCLVVFIPATAYFTVHFISLFKKPIYALLLNIILFFAPTSILWGVSHNWIPQAVTTPDVSSLAPYKEMVKGKRIMVLGSAKNLYKNASLAGPFYDWGLSKTFFSNLDYYDNLVFLQNQLNNANPEVIIDLENNWKNISKGLPTVAAKYRLAQANVWVRKKQ